MYKRMLNLNGNLMCSVDVETTGRMPGYHEIIQIAVQPLDSDFDPIKELHPFYMTIAPEFPERAEREATRVHGLVLEDLQVNSLDKYRAAGMFEEWFQNLNLPFRKSIVPLAHNWAFEAGFLKSWLGIDLFNEYFHPHPRDSMLFAIALNDRAYCRCEDELFKAVSLTAMCKQLNIVSMRAHDALSDALAEAQVYKTLMQLSVV